MDADSLRYCGHVAIVGRPNVGKSTLLNHLIGQKLSITSRKPQTTRHQVLGIRSEGSAQLIFIDTPGLHIEEPRAINRYMNRAARAALRGVDALVVVLDRTAWTDNDQALLDSLQGTSIPVIAAVNKVDLVADKGELLPHLDWLSQQFPFRALIPISALAGRNLDALLKELLPLLPVNSWLFPEDQISDRNERFFVAEIVREKLIRQLGDELPYTTTVEVEQFAQQGDIVHISALIYVERPGQKRIVIGEAGSRLRSIGTEARADIERFLGQRVMLKLWVKVRRGWADDERALRSLGFEDPRS